MLLKISLTPYFEIELVFKDKLEDNSKFIPSSLHELVVFHRGLAKWLIAPVTPEIVKTVVTIAQQKNIPLSNEEQHLYLFDNPEKLVESFQAARIALSHAFTTSEIFDRLKSYQLPQHILAGVNFALRTRRCLIADVRAEDRRLVAYLAVYQARMNLCTIVCRKAQQHFWRELQDKYPINLKINFVDIEALENHPEKSPTNNERRKNTLIVEDIHLFKNPQSKRTKNLGKMVGFYEMRFFLTDFPLNISPADLAEPYRLLFFPHRYKEFQQSLQRFEPDPLNQAISQQQTAEIYRTLRSQCMLRRALNPGLQRQDVVIPIPLGNLPPHIPVREVKSPLREVGLCKVTEAVEVLRGILAAVEGKTLILAHHHDVVEEIAATLNCPAIYGKVRDPQVRAALAAEFAAREGAAALIVADDVELQWHLGDVRQVVAVELLLTPREIDRIKNWLTQSEQPLLWYWFYAHNPLDQQAIKRLRLRLADYNRMMDEITAE